MKYGVSWNCFGYFLPDSAIEMGRDYLYCPLTQPAVRARLYGYHMSSCRHKGLTYIWREILPSGVIGERRETPGWFKTLPNEVTLPLKYGNPIVMLRGNLTAGLRLAVPVVPALINAGLA